MTTTSGTNPLAWAFGDDDDTGGAADLAAPAAPVPVAPRGASAARRRRRRFNLLFLLLLVLIVAGAGLAAVRAIKSFPQAFPSVCAVTCSPGQEPAFSVATLPPGDTNDVGGVAAGAAGGGGAAAAGGEASAVSQSAAAVNHVLPPTPAAALVPAHLVIPSLQVDAQVVAAPVSVTDGFKDVTPPENVRQVGLVDGSALVGGKKGTVTVAGHINSAQQGEGALYQLADIRAGAYVYLNTGGVLTVWRVVAKVAVVKSALPVDVFAGNTGPRLLKLVTCGGPFDSDTGHFEDNTIVTAIPA